MALNFTEEQRNTATAQIMIDHVQALRNQAESFRKMEAPVLASVFDETATGLEEEINRTLSP